MVIIVGAMPLNVITLDLAKSDNNKRIITLTLTFKGVVD